MLAPRKRIRTLFIGRLASGELILIEKPRKIKQKPWWWNYVTRSLDGLYNFIAGFFVKYGPGIYAIAWLLLCNWLASYDQIVRDALPGGYFSIFLVMWFSTQFSLDQALGVKSRQLILKLLSVLVDSAVNNRTDSSKD
jgi:hypothetical protein